MSEIKNNKNEKKSGFKIHKSPFIEYLVELEKRQDRGALAALRRGLQHEPGTCIDMYPYVIPWLQNVKGKWKKNMYYLIASLFAYHPSISHAGNMGDVFRQISQKRGDNKSLEQRFMTLLRCNPEDLPFHMRQIISIAKSENIPIFWHELFFDLMRWPYATDYPPYEKWANSFWKNEKKKEDNGKDKKNIKKKE